MMHRSINGSESNKDMDGEKNSEGQSTSNDAICTPLPVNPAGVGQLLLKKGEANFKLAIHAGAYTENGTIEGQRNPICFFLYYQSIYGF